MADISGISFVNNVGSEIPMRRRKTEKRKYWPSGQTSIQVKLSYDLKTDDP